MPEKEEFKALYKKHGSFMVRKAQRHFANRKEGMPQRLTPSMLNEWIVGQQKGLDGLIKFRK